MLDLLQGGPGPAAGVDVPREQQDRIRLIVAVAAPVTMFVEPGPIEAVQASVDRRRRPFANPIAAWTMLCSLRAWWYGITVDSRSIASPRPVTLPWPKIPKIPAMSRSRSPSRSLNWTDRKRMIACAVVRRTSVDVDTGLPRYRLAGRMPDDGDRVTRRPPGTPRSRLRNRRSGRPPGRSSRRTRPGGTRRRSEGSRSPPCRARAVRERRRSGRGR